LPPDVLDQKSFLDRSRWLFWLLIVACAVGIPTILYAIKFWRLLIPLFAAASQIHRVGYRAVVDRLAGVGWRRQHGETWDEFAARLHPVTPSFTQLTEIHLERSFSTAPEPDKKSWKVIETNVNRQIAEKVPAHRRWWGRLNPCNWIGVG